MRSASPPPAWAVVPVKGLARAKTRLARILPPATRRELVTTMFGEVLDVLLGAAGIGPILVVTADPRIAALGERKGALILREARSSGLNSALRRGARHARRAGASRVLFIPADVPLTTPAEIARIVSSSPPDEGAHALIVPAQLGGGTNALMLSPPDALSPNFGEQSFAAHCRQAAERGLATKVVRLGGLGRDIDEPADLAALLEAKARSGRYAFLRAAVHNYEIRRETSGRIAAKRVPVAPIGVSEP